MCRNNAIESDLLPGEKLLFHHVQPRGWHWWRQWIADIFVRALPVFFLLMVPVVLCCARLAPAQTMFWLCVVLSVMLLMLVTYVRHRLEEFTCLRVTSQRVISHERAEGHTMVWSYPLPLLQVQQGGLSVTLRCRGIRAKVEFRGVKDTLQLVALIQQAQVDYRPLPVPEPLQGGHPLLPPGELLYGAGVEVLNHPTCGEWVFAASLVLFCVSVAVGAALSPQETSFIGWFVWFLLAQLAFYIVRVFRLRGRAKPIPYAIGSSGVHSPERDWEPCPLSCCYPIGKELHEDGSAELLFTPPIESKVLPGLHVADYCETETLLMSLWAHSQAIRR